jgi:hypothetical protein
MHTNARMDSEERAVQLVYVDAPEEAAKAAGTQSQERAEREQDALAAIHVIAQLEQLGMGISDAGGRWQLERRRWWWRRL